MPRRVSSGASRTAYNLESLRGSGLNSITEPLQAAIVVLVVMGIVGAITITRRPIEKKCANKQYVKEIEPMTVAEVGEITALAIMTVEGRTAKIENTHSQDW